LVRPPTKSPEELEDRIFSELEKNLKPSPEVKKFFDYYVKEKGEEQEKWEDSYEPSFPNN